MTQHTGTSSESEQVAALLLRAQRLPESWYYRQLRNTERLMVATQAMLFAYVGNEIIHGQHLEHGMTYGGMVSAVLLADLGVRRILRREYSRVESRRQDLTEAILSELYGTNHHAV